MEFPGDAIGWKAERPGHLSGENCMHCDREEQHKAKPHVLMIHARMKGLGISIEQAGLLGPGTGNGERDYTSRYLLENRKMCR